MKLLSIKLLFHATMMKSFQKITVKIRLSFEKTFAITRRIKEKPFSGTAFFTGMTGAIMKKIVPEKRNILVSRALVYFFTLVLIAMDALGWWIGMRMEGAAILHHTVSFEDSLCFLICLYSCSIPAFIVLYDLHRLLINISSGKIFIPENVKHLRRCSWCLLSAATICLIGIIWLRVLLIIVSATCFVGVIVRIIMNIFEQAISMKEELDLTV